MKLSKNFTKNAFVDGIIEQLSIDWGLTDFTFETLTKKKIDPITKNITNYTVRYFVKTHIDNDNQAKIIFFIKRDDAINKEICYGVELLFKNELNKTVYYLPMINGLQELKGLDNYKIYKFVVEQIQKYIDVVILHKRKNRKYFYKNYTMEKIFEIENTEFNKEKVKKHFNLVDKDEYLELKNYCLELKKQIYSYQDLTITRDYVNPTNTIYAVNDITLHEIVNSKNSFLLWNSILINHEKGHINIIPYTVDTTNLLTKEEIDKKEK